MYDTNDLSGIPQMWCMYKEVAEYYVQGVSGKGVLISSADVNPSSRYRKMVRAELSLNQELMYFSVDPIRR